MSSGRSRPLTRRLDRPTTSATSALECRVAADQLRAREPILQVADQRVGIVAEQDRATPLSVAATSTAPSDASPTAKRMFARPAPPRRGRRHAEPAVAVS